jgi:hypothetical protein
VKLNVGCGWNCLEGWVNLDPSADSAADRKMSAQDLDFPDGSVTDIKALQLIEHLGFFKAKYFLSECWRVLAAGGRLTLETPDIEKTFRIFLEGDPKTKESALGWVYGSETPGMNHLYCFPKELLSELLAEAGFSPAVPEEFLFGPGRPALRFAVSKAGGEKPALSAALRRRLLDKGLADFSSEETSAALELAVRKLAGAGGEPGKALEQALCSAPAALEYFSLLEENEPRPSPEASACARLAAWRIQGRLSGIYEVSLSKGADPEAAFAAAMAAGRALLAAALSGSGETPDGCPAEGAPAVFSLLSAEAWHSKNLIMDLRRRGKIL